MNEKEGRSGTKRMGGTSTYSTSTNARRNRMLMREEMITKKITQIFNDKERDMIKEIWETVLEDKKKQYLIHRGEYEQELIDIENEKRKIMKKKRNKKDRNKALKNCTRQQLYYFCKALNSTVIYYKGLYHENDYYRHKKLLDVQQEADKLGDGNKTEGEKARLAQLNDFFQSPFKKDRAFVIQYMAQMTRDRIEMCQELIKNLFFDKIFKLMLDTRDEKIRLKSFEIMCNMIHVSKWRNKLAEQNYFKRVYQDMEISKTDEKTLEKLSWMTTLVCFHPDMISQIKQLKLLQFIMKLIDNKHPAIIRSNAVLAISLLTYHEELFNDLIDHKVIDLVMKLCMNKDDQIQVKQFATLALVHFALSKNSIKILINKGIMTLFNSLGMLDNVQIQTNVSWIFLALCNNGITGKEMLVNGITRDMFLVSCNPQFHQIRHLVIAGFAELGRCTELREAENLKLKADLQKIKEKAIVGMHTAFKDDANKTIDTLLKFSISTDIKFKSTAFWALKDYILLNHKNLIEDLSGIISAFVNGSAEPIDQVNTECANAISFLITHHLVYRKEGEVERDTDGNELKAASEVDNPDQAKSHVLDALMLLTGSESKQVRTRAFSTLSTLSTYASQSKVVMQQIHRDIQLPIEVASSMYEGFISERLKTDLKDFHRRYQCKNIESNFAGLYCLLVLAKDPSGTNAGEASRLMHSFFFPEFTQHDDDKDVDPKSCSVQVGREDEIDVRQIELEALNEKYFMFVFKALLFTKDRKILYRLLDVVNFYIKHETKMQFEIVEPGIILWMLKILDKHRSDQYLCLLAAKTVLKVVENHSVVFDYQEMAIIKNFNKALENIEGNASPRSPCDSDEENEESEGGEDEKTKVEIALSESMAAISEKQLMESLSHSIQSQEKLQELIRSQSGIKSDGQHTGNLSEMLEQPAISEPKDMDSDNLDSAKVQSEAVKSNKSIEGQAKETQKSVQSGRNRSKQASEKVDSIQKSSQHVKSSHHSAIVKESSIQKSSVQKSKFYENKDKSKFEGQEERSIKLSDSERSESILDKDIPVELDANKKTSEQADEVVTSQKSLNIMSQEVQEDQVQASSKSGAEKTKQQSSLNIMSQGVDEQSKELQESSPSKEELSIQQKRSTLNQMNDELQKEKMKLKVSKELVRKNQPVFQSRDMMQVDENGALIQVSGISKQAHELRDALIKSFMVIFTNEKSQHLLLNKDIIDIAFNCLEFCSQISVEAKRNLSRLISIIFKFPQVQDRIIDELVVLGVVHLLTQTTGQKEIIRHAVKACGYIALNFDFVNSDLSLKVTKALTPLLIADIDESRENYENDPDSRSTENTEDRDACIFAIANLLKGKSANAMHFVQTGCCERIMSVILQKETNLQNVDLYFSCLAQLGNQKKIFRMFLDMPINLKLLPLCMAKCVQLSEQWHTDVRELSLYSKIFTKKEEDFTEAERREQKTAQKNQEYQKIMNLDYKNVDASKALDNVLEATQSFNIQMTPMCKIRNNCYYLFKMCFKFRFQPEFWINQCALFENMIGDLQRDEINDFIFNNLTLGLVSVQKDQTSTKKFLVDHSSDCLNIFDKIQDQNKQLVFLKTLCQLILSVPDYICNGNPELFSKLLQKAITFADISEEITENVLWLQSSLLDLYQNDQQLESAIEVFQQLQTAKILSKCLLFPSERILLQTLKSLSSLASLPQFRATLLIDLGDAIFPTLAELVTKRMKELKEYPLEIETELVQMLTLVTASEVNPTKDALTVAARRRVVQQGFMEYFLNRSVEVGYQISQDEDSVGDMDLDEVLDEDNLNSMDYPTGRDLNEKPDFEKLFQLNFEQIDEIDKLDSTNSLVEKIMSLTANVTEQSENASTLLKAQCNLLVNIKTLLHKIMTAVTNLDITSPEDNLMQLGYGNLMMIKAVSLILRNLCAHSDKIDQAGPISRSKKKRQMQQIVSSQHLLIQNGLLQMIMQAINGLVDYEVHVNLYTGIGHLLQSPHRPIAESAVKHGCLKEIIQAQEDSQFFKVRRHCANVLAKLDEEILELDQK